MAELDVLFSEKGDWLEVFWPYQRESVAKLLDDGKTPYEVAQVWLTVSGPSNTFPYGGGSRFPTVFYDKLLDELVKFFCDDKSYVQERREIIAGLGKGRSYVVVAIAVAIAPHLGAAEQLLAPAIALILLGAANVTVNAFCETITAMRGNPESK